ncbi:MAG: rRNA maturation RNase YbeY [Rhodobacter sp.]|jgi:probable rRNA maturation factor|nr:rRNA maturation RNase YbeY [Rhodobacter sp.]MCA3494373.1 rRNA maturation RNase YbeY [Rhodobacter sp.]MCA3499847.1 rRNA maturation RNase YbeY [Rhodobacter sp.]MCA3503836.1 rRNA maturation RNase YbeY [Rhodobacter sp.]MCA3517830.1 rRNA maturation RNase YbeY [Rhodobacter sp.]
MGPLVDTVMEDPRWQDSLPRLADSAARATLAELSLDPARFEIVVMGCDDARIATLNAEFRGKPAATNVLSWPTENRAADSPGGMPTLPPGQAAGTRELGDIAISYDSCAREAAEQGKSMDDHVTHLIVHAVLHLLGYDHADDADAALMEHTEIRVLAKLGVTNPY